MMFYVTLMRCEYRDVSLLKSVHPIQRATASWDYAFTGSKNALPVLVRSFPLRGLDRKSEPCERKNSFHHVFIYLPRARIFKSCRLEIVPLAPRN